MTDRPNPGFRKPRYLYGWIILPIIAIVGITFSLTNQDGLETDRREVLLRRIGDELLTQSGDRTSRVLPVQKVAVNEYKISFEKGLAFRPDSLVNTTRRLLARDPLATDYVVNVLNPNASVAYGFAVSADKRDDIIACIGRVQPEAPYVINVKFKPAGINMAKHGYLLGTLPLLAFAGFVFFRSVTGRREAPRPQFTGMVALGPVLFDEKNRQLTIQGNTIDLTATETRIMGIFAQAPNDTIERSRLQKEIWEDEGVIVGRSLDMFISKLRKKLEPAPDINIVVVRSKGYKLEVNA
ncbi:winged helix-turn-helix domain-containing protein [Chitinophaga rhizosphaerae]|uniref:winged helix-turn-helix domain-containing protein n=1 Tax=Chitinophaga rhizosphaerae TaxID=1864947 RepID=UPI000F813278|nr:winged helix-turn-helix domain-containing protein [Chitinophaga rhizosphaerae]